MILADYLLTPVSAIDLMILFLMVWGGYKGFVKGFLAELLMLILFIVSILVVFKLIEAGYDFTATRAGKFAKAFPFFTFAILYALISLGISLLGRMIKGMLPTVFEGFDKILGATLGVVKYCLSLGILFKLLVSVGIFDRTQISKSTIFYPIIMSVFDKSIEVGAILAPFIGDMVKNIEKLLK